MTPLNIPWNRVQLVALQHQYCQSTLLQRWRSFASNQSTLPERHQHKPRLPVPGGLLTTGQAAAKLGISTKTLSGHVASGALRYVIIGHGTRRPRKMFTDVDLSEFIQAQTRKDAPCLSDATRAHRSGSIDSKSEVVAFSVL